MAYYVRVFCKSDELPPLRSVLEWAGGEGVRLEAPSSDLDAADWEQAEVTYNDDRRPIIAERNTGVLAREEVEEFIEFLEDVDESSEKENVLEHLEQSRAVVAAQLLGDIDDDGYAAAGTFLDYFVQHCGGLIQADGEGFYEGDRLVVALE